MLRDWWKFLINSLWEIEIFRLIICKEIILLIVIWVNLEDFFLVVFLDEIFNCVFVKDFELKDLVELFLDIWLIEILI